MSQRAAEGMKKSPVHGPWLSGKKLLTLQGLICLPLQLCPFSHTCVSPLVQSQKVSSYLNGHYLCCPQQYHRPFQEKELREKRLSPRVTLCIRAVWGSYEVNSKVFWVSWVVSPCFFLSTALHLIYLFPMGLQLEKHFLFIIISPEAQVVSEPHFILIGAWGDLHTFLK